MAAINSIMFSVHGSCMRYLQPQGGNNLILNSSIAGGAAGTVQCAVCIPTELIKLRMQMQNVGQDASTHSLFHVSKQAPVKYIGPLDTALNIYHTNGARGLYKGGVVTVWREAPAFATYFAMYDYLRQIQVSKGGSLDDLSPASLMVAGGISGVLAWIVTYPFDVVKSRIQCDGMPGTDVQYKGMIDCFRKSYLQDGISVFFRGFNATVWRAFPVNAATFSTVTLILRKLNPPES